jgi:predicted amidohydrolase
MMVNRVGQGDDDLVFAGGSAVIDPFSTTDLPLLSPIKT